MATLNPNSTASEIDAFIDQACARLNEMDKKGILTCQMNISYNVSYFNEKEGELKGLILESVHALSAAVSKMREVVPSDVTALRTLKETIGNHIKMGRSCLEGAGQILSGGEASISIDDGEDRDCALVYLKCWEETDTVIQDLNALVAEFDAIEPQPTVSTESEEEDAETPSEDTIPADHFGVADITKRFTDELENQLSNGRKDIEEKAEEQDQETEDKVRQQETKTSVYDENITRGGLLEKADVNYSNHSER